MERPSGIEMWAEEAVENVAATRFRIEKTLYSAQSRYQKIDILKSVGFGRMFFLDGIVMLSERDEFIYHEMIAHPVLRVHPKPNRVLIIGGGDGGTAREVLRHSAVDRCVMVEIDGMVVEAAKEYLPFTASELRNPRLEVRIADGVKFMAETDERFDVILVDSTDPIGPATPLFGEAFYRDVYRVLSDDGIVVAQGESPFYDPDAQESILKSMSASFQNTYLYNYSNLTYPGGLWSFAVGSKKYCPRDGVSASIQAQKNLTFRYYNQSLHVASFVLPEFQKEKYRAYLSAQRAH